MSARGALLALSGMILLFAGCASVATEEEWAAVAAFSRERTGAGPLWIKSEEDAKAAAATAASLLADGLTMEEAVRIALMSNRSLQAAFEEIGIAKADLVQAGLPTNPSLSALLLFPSGGGGRELDLEGIVNIADLWHIPLKKKKAGASLEAALIRVNGLVLETAAAAKQAYIDYLALAQMLREAEALREEMQKWREHLDYRRQFGFTGSLDLLEADDLVAEAELSVKRAERERAVARARLNRILGLPGGAAGPEARQYAGYTLSGTLAEPAEELPALQQLLDRAFAQRPDMLIAHLKREEARRALELERLMIFKEVGAGAAFKHETEGADLFGPAVSLQLPLFDQNRAMIARAAFRLRQAEKEVEEKRGALYEEVVQAYEQLSALKHELALFRTALLPSRREAVAFSEKYYDAMQISMLPLLESRRKLLEANRRYLETLREYHRGVIELEKITGGALWGGARTDAGSPAGQSLHRAR